ncbi:MAG TPA: hypothetical protein VMA72_17970 [Streptosporangiaceae bacterium]|nr:hypothetical protein [Streptosporangiaceae bacterium]
MTDIQATHAPAVLAGDLKLCTTWGAPGVGYLLLFRPDPAASAALAGVQEQVLAMEPDLLRQPQAQLHTSVAWLLPVAREFSKPKDALWAEHGERWLTAIAAITEGIPPMRLCYRRLVVTDAAIIAVAEEPTPVGAFRRELTAALGLSWPISYSSVDIVHTTLFRYPRPLSDPAGLLRRVEAMPVAIETGVSEFLMVRESMYFTFCYEVLQRLPLGVAP